MNSRSVFFAASFVLGHIVLVAPFVPVANILPAGLGALAISSMALSLILAARWRIVDYLTGGPDKSYVLHRYLGFFALFGTLGHWGLASSVGSGVLPVLAESGEEIGNIAAMGLLGMTGAAMVRVIPYHLWKMSHMLMGPIFLIAVYHTFFVASPLALGAVPWVVMAAMSSLGIVAWLQTLLRKRSPTRLMSIEKLAQFDGGIDLTLRAEKPLPPFRPGQFATLAFNEASAEAHPFSIAGGDNTSRRFIIRSAGDWTSDLSASAKIGDQLRVSRGTGRFLPQTTTRRKQQLWVAGGVGITPFLAALETMKPDNNAPITLIYCIRSHESAAALKDVEYHAERLPQIDLMVLSKARHDELTSDRLQQIIQGMSADSRAYLCGPEALKSLVTRVWEETGMTNRVRSERFDFRGAYGLTELGQISKLTLGFCKNALTFRRRQSNATAGS